MNQRAPLGPPDRFFIQNLAALIPQLLDDTCALIEVMPKQASIEKIKLALLYPRISRSRALWNSRAAVVIDDQQPCGAELQDLAELTFVLGRFDSKSDAAIGRRHLAYSRVR